MLTDLCPGRYGDMRAMIGASIRDMWYSLGEPRCAVMGNFGVSLG